MNGDGNSEVSPSAITYSGEGEGCRGVAMAAHENGYQFDQEDQE